MSDRGKITNRSRAKQLIDFSGLKYGSITPTNIDSAPGGGFMDFGDKIFVEFELKYLDAPTPYGQKLAFERRVDAYEDAGKNAIFIIAEHNIHNPHDDVPAHLSIVREYRTAKRWRIPTRITYLKRIIDAFLKRFHVIHNVNPNIAIIQTDTECLDNYEKRYLELNGKMPW